MHNKQLFLFTLTFNFMKAKFLALAALVLGLASCQNDPDVVAPVGADEVTVQLAVSADELATRAGKDGAADTQAELNSAFGAIDYLQGAPVGDYRQDWNDVDLRYVLEVYDVATDYTNATPVKDRQVIIKDAYEPVVFDLRLVPNREYRFVVFADFVANGSAAKSEKEQLSVNGIRHEIGATLADITVFNEAINDEVGDAYFAIEDIEITNSAAQNIVLRRPYGKIRVVATDLAELNTNIDPKSVVFTYNALNPNKFNAVTGAISGEYVKKEFNGEYIDKVRTNMASHIYNAGYDAEVATAVNGTTTRNSHITLVTDYILATDTQKAIQFTMIVKDATGKEIKTTVFNTDIPVQRNYLTTVIGNVLTTATEIKVTIDDNFAGEIKKNVVYVDSAIQLQTALDNFENGQTIIFANDIKGNVTAEQVDGENIIIDGNRFKYDGTISIDGNSRHTGTETITIQNINFETNDSLYFIEQNSADGAVRYPHNVTIKDCSFKGAADKTVVGMRFRQGYNIVVENCVADGTTRASASNLHSLAQLYGCTGVRFEGISVNASEGGVSFGTSTNCVIKDATIVAGDYGVRADASVETTLDIEDVNIEATVPVIARYFTGNYTINFLGDNELEAPGYQVVLTNGKDDAAFVAPTGTYTLTGADNFRVFPGYDKLYAYNQASLQYLLDNAVDGDVIEFAADIEGDVTVNQKKDVKIAIEGNDHIYAGVITVDGKSMKHEDAGDTGVTIKNLNIEAEAISADACIRLGISGNNNTRYTHNVAVEDCTFNVPGAVAIKSYTGGDKNLSIKGCTATGLHSLLQVKNIEGITIDGVNITAGRGASFGASSDVVVKNSTFVADSYGLRADASGEATLAIENVNITAYQPVIARYATGNYTIKFSGDNNVLNGAVYQVIVTNDSDDKEYTLPTGTYNIIGADNFLVYPSDADFTAYAGTADEFTAALASGKTTIVLDDNAIIEGKFTINKNVNITSVNGATLKGRIEAFNASVKFENVKFDYNDVSSEEFSSSIVGNPKGHPAIIGVYGGTAHAVTFEGCEFICKSGYSAALAPGAITHYGGVKLTLKDCTIDCEGNPIYAKTNIEMTGCTIKMYGNNAVLSLNYSNEGRTVIFKNNIVENKSTNGNQTYAMQFLSTNGKAYSNMYFDVQGNTVDNLFAMGSGYTFTNATYANGSATL